MSKEILCSSNSIKGLEEKIKIITRDDKSHVDGKKVISKQHGLTFKQNGNVFVCYIEEEKSSIDKLRDERVDLLVSRNNPSRLIEVQAKLDYFDYGIK